MNCKNSRAAGYTHSSKTSRLTAEAQAAVTMTVAITTGRNQTAEDRNQRQNQRDGRVWRRERQLKERGYKEPENRTGNSSGELSSL